MFGILHDKPKPVKPSAKIFFCCLSTTQLWVKTLRRKVAYLLFLYHQVNNQVEQRGASPRR
ncbi:MAG: hypothetical protein LBG58_10240, partial [Planctomycetaceae bacterium]|nr:hypothetical protein [Planctomycetaceae bacterium]